MRKRKSDKGTSSASIVKRNRRMDEPPSNFVSRRSLRWIPVRPLFSYTLLWSFSNRASYPWCRRRRRRRRCTFKPTKPRTARKWCIASTWARFIASYLKKLKRYSFRGEYRICVTQREERSSCRESDTRTVANIRFGNWEERPLETDRIFRVPSIFSNLFIEIYVPERIISFQHRIFFKRMGSATMLRTSRSLQVERRFEEKRERKRIQYRGNPRRFLYKSKEKKKKILHKIRLPWTVDHLARGSMKNAANCASTCELQDTWTSTFRTHIAVHGYNSWTTPGWGSFT